MYFRQPSYFSDFRCIGGTCKFSCCIGWNIAWTDEEIAKVKNAACSDTLKSLMESSFEKTDNSPKNNRIILKEGGRCPFLTEENLCIIQKELGEDYLCETCYEFPRKYRMAFDVHSKRFTHIYRSCNLSCPEVSKRLLSDKKAMTLVNVPVKENARLSAVRRDSKETFQKHPEYFYRIDLFELFYSMLSDKKIPIETAIIRGASVADMLSRVVADRQHNILPQLIAQIKSGASDGKIFRQLDSIESDVDVKLGFLGGIMDKLVGNTTLDMLKTEDGSFSLALYEQGEKNLSAISEINDFGLRNIALNLLFELAVPFYSDKFTISENYAYFLVTFACIKLNAIASMSRDEADIDMRLSGGHTASFSGEERVSGFASVISRELCQNHDNVPKVMEALREAKMLSPAALAKLIK